jgi:hypothetical protein
VQYSPNATSSPGFARRPKSAHAPEGRISLVPLSTFRPSAVGMSFRPEGRNVQRSSYGLTSNSSPAHPDDHIAHFRELMIDAIFAFAHRRSLSPIRRSARGAFGSRVRFRRPSCIVSLSGFDPFVVNVRRAPSVRAINSEESSGGYRSGLPGRLIIFRAEALPIPIQPSTDPPAW